MAAGIITLIVKDSEGTPRQARFWSTTGDDTGFLTPIQMLDLGQLADIIAAVGGASVIVPGGGTISLPGGSPAVNVVPTSVAPRGVALRNLGGVSAGDYITYATGATADGGIDELRVYIGERIPIGGGGRFIENVSVFAAQPTTLQWETWQ